MPVARQNLAWGWLLLLAGGVFLPALASADEPAPKRPNILLIYTDDQSHRTLSCYPEAYDWVRTPNIDRLARRGVRFTHAYVGTWCMPSRASLLTGHHSYGVQSMRMEGPYPASEYDPAQCPFWPKVFREQGYCTAQIGKWHTGTDTGAGRDWDFQKVWNRPRHLGNQRAYYNNQLIETNGGKAALVKGYSTDNYTQWAADFIRGKERDTSKPWYLWLCYSAVHNPFTPAERHLEAAPGAQVPTPADIYPPRPGKPAYMQQSLSWVKGPNGQPVQKGEHGLHGNTLSDWVRQYQQGVLAIDEGVGKLMQTLEETGQLENTLVVFTSDQGFAWGEHGFAQKHAPYDATLRAPLIVSLPGVLPENEVCKTPVGGVDLVPTFFRFAGLELPWKMHGHDLTPLLKHPAATWDHPVLLASTAQSFGANTETVPTDPKDLYFADVPWWVFLVDGRYKYIRTLIAGEPEELYDLQADPEELTNLASSPAFQDRLLAMRKATLAELRRTDAKLAENLPKVKGE